MKDPIAHQPPRRIPLRIDPDKVPMHVMATWALLQLPDHEGTFSDMCVKIEANALFRKQLDRSYKPSTKSFPRYVASRHLTAASPVPIRIMLFVSIASVLVVLPGYLQHGAVRCPGRAASCNRHHAHPRPQPMRYYGTGAD